MTTTTVEITSFGYLHDAPPSAHLIIDLRHHFRDPHITPGLRYMTAHDEPVRAAVLATSGIGPLLGGVLTSVAAFRAGPSAGTVIVAVGCAGGRHRAPAFSQALADMLTATGHTVTVQHRDLEKPVVDR
ncbi:ATPase [Streptomyces aquilus]|uniref:RapZ C-terminal domain-containing protein n=1 Tax=Streptomyces aquilus TaxID=2548456 RepID=UPI0037D2A515